MKYIITELVPDDRNNRTIVTGRQVSTISIEKLL